MTDVHKQEQLAHSPLTTVDMRPVAEPEFSTCVLPQNFPGRWLKWNQAQIFRSLLVVHLFVFFIIICILNLLFCFV